MQEEGLDVEAALKAVQAATALARPNRAFLAGGDVRMGDFILLVDSDTRVPQHCILPVVSELLCSPHVAFTQHYTTPLQARTAPLSGMAVLLHAAISSICVPLLRTVPCPSQCAHAIETQQCNKMLLSLILFGMTQCVHVEAPQQHDATCSSSMCYHFPRIRAQLPWGHADQPRLL